MKLWIMRHGEAEPLKGDNDRQRGLTSRGQHQAQASAEWLRAQGVAGLSVIVSPYQRAQETAAIVADVIPAARIESLALLEPSGDPRKVTAWLASREETELLLVSHMPLVGQLVSWLEDGVLSSGPAFAVAQLSALEMTLVGVGQASCTGVHIPG